MKTLPCLLAVLLLAGCVSFGTKFDPSRIPQIRHGQTTEAELKEWFGTSMSISMMASGARKHVWMYGRAGLGSLLQDVLEVIVSTNGIVTDHNAIIRIPATNAPVSPR